MNENNIDIDFMNEIKHDEINKFCESIDHMRNNWDLLNEKLKEEKTIYLGVKEDNVFDVRKFKIEIPQFKLKNAKILKIE